MEILCVVLLMIVLFLVVYLLLLRKSITDTNRQMDEIEKYPERNRQLKAITTDQGLEELQAKINLIYADRQKERIIYQRRETKIREEIENISHDLRTPLTSILGYLDLLGDSTTQEERTEYLELIKKRARLLQGFIQDFYEISRIEADDYPLTLDIINIQGLLKDTLVTYYNDFEKKKLAVTVELNDKPAYIIADKIQIMRVLNNLLQNALKYADEIFIVEEELSGDYYVLRLINDKNNLNENEVKHIFERFYTGDHSRSNQSTGLGLTITRILVEKMNGMIEARLKEDLFVVEVSWPLYRKSS